MPDPIDVTPGVRILPGALEMHAVRSSGPGGQNVNKVSSKILLFVDFAGIEGLDAVARRRLVSIAGRRITADGRLLITAGESRDRFRNLEAAREKVRQLVARALVVPKVRRPTGPSAAARERRLSAKKRDATVKAVRRERPLPEEE
ncbi:MAG: alternative ribosome rescue aminoacyl-tRNA hydrolase ArfB [Thermoanaerobaculia bacterium]